MKCTNTRKNTDPEGVYIYCSVVDQENTPIRIGEEGVTEEWIKLLKNMDDSEAARNMNYVTGMTPQMRRERKEKWEAANPGKEYTFLGYTVSRDAFLSEEALFGHGEDSTSDEAPAEEENLGSCGIYGLAAMASPQVERLREIVAELPEREQKIYTWINQEGCSQQMAANRLGISQKHVSRLQKKIEKRIAQDSVLKRIYGC